MFDVHPDIIDIIPAKAGIQGFEQPWAQGFWIPAFAGMTVMRHTSCQCRPLKTLEDTKSGVVGGS